LQYFSSLLGEVVFFETAGGQATSVFKQPITLAMPEALGEPPACTSLWLQGNSGGS